MTNPVAFYDEITSSVDKGGVADVFYLDFNMAFNIVSYNILKNKLMKCRLDKRTEENWKLPESDKKNKPSYQSI